MTSRAIRFLLVIVCALFCVPALLRAQIASSPDSLLMSKVDGLMAPYVQLRTFRGNALIAEGKSVVLSRGYGMSTSGENSAVSYKDASLRVRIVKCGKGAPRTASGTQRRRINRLVVTRIKSVGVY